MRVRRSEHAGSCGEEGRREDHGSVLVVWVRVLLLLLWMMDMVMMGLLGTVGIICRRGCEMVLGIRMHRVVWRGHVNDG